MRRAQQQEILELVKTLHEAHAEIKGNIEKRKNHIAQSMLADCQECAISIGNVIEAFEGEGFITISYLEEYCQILFTSHESLNEFNVNENRIYKNLEKQLIRIENSIKNDIPIRKEIAFFPYKASMWDSLESIYLAAKEDPEVEAYCVPIPYYDLKPDRSFGEMHYEGLEYPKNIEVIDWKTYNFEERKPDVIYIHNPYDNWNLVTSVHPRFYSDRLKAATEELVYVPYFVLQEMKPTNQHAIDGMKHFCYLPGIINADKVILQSENMAKIYINEYQKAAKANGLAGRHIDRSALEEKFLGLGSPKFDKVQNTKKEDLDIPEEWLKIIEKPDGSWKKIIFYNTSIAALLEHNEKMLEKMKWVFDIFKENKDEVALLWRPHPLIKNTVSAMRPWLWAEYDKLVQQYKVEGWGIYDDTADMDRAVVLSDAYYGDPSSVVQVYQKTGKPVMIQNIEAKGHMLETLGVGAVVEYDEKLWIYNFKDNGIYTVDKRTFEAELKCWIPWRYDNDGMLPEYYRCFLYKSKIFLLPDKGSKICVYDISGNQLRFIEKSGTSETMTGFREGILSDKRLILLENGCRCLLEINMDMEEVKQIDIHMSDSSELKGTVWGGIYYSERKILFTIIEKSNVYEVDTETGVVNTYECSELQSGGGGVYGNKDNIWVLPLIADKAIIWDKSIEKKTIYYDFPDEYNALKYQPNDFSFFKTLQGEEVYFLPRCSDVCLKLDLSKNRFEVCCKELMRRDIDNYYDKYMIFSTIFKVDDKKYLFESKTGMMYVINNNGDVENRSIKIVRKVLEDTRELPFVERMCCEGGLLALVKR